MRKETIRRKKRLTFRLPTRLTYFSNGRFARWRYEPVQEILSFHCFPCVRNPLHFFLSPTLLLCFFFSFFLRKHRETVRFLSMIMCNNTTQTTLRRIVFFEKKSFFFFSITSMFSKLFFAAAMVAMVSAASPSGTYKGSKSVLGQTVVRSFVSHKTCLRATFTSYPGRNRHDRGRLTHESGD